MSNNVLPFALSFERQYAGPLDPTSVFATIAERDAYLNNATRYPGQPVTCLEAPGKIFVLSSDRSAWLESGGDAPKPMVFETDAEMQAYLTNDARYAGQVVTCLETIDKQYILSADMSYWEVAGCGFDHTHDVSQISLYDQNAGQSINLGDRLNVMAEIDRYLSNNAVISVSSWEELRDALSLNCKTLTILLSQSWFEIPDGTVFRLVPRSVLIIGGQLKISNIDIVPDAQDGVYVFRMAGAIQPIDPIMGGRILFCTVQSDPAENAMHSNLQLFVHTLGNIEVTKMSSHSAIDLLCLHFGSNYLPLPPQPYIGDMYHNDDGTFYWVRFTQLTVWTDITPWSNMSESNTQLYIEDIAMLAGVLNAHSQAMSNIASGLHGYSVPELEATDITGSEDIMIRQEGTFVTVKTDLLKQYILRDMGGIYRWTDSGEDQILGAAWTLEGTLVGDKFDIVIRMAVSPVTGSSVDSLEIRPLAQFAGMRVHSKFLECIVTESTDDGSGTMGLLVYHFYQNNEHAYANQMSSLNEINESCYISNYNDTQSSSYYYNSGVLADANDIVFAFNGDGYWETRPVRRVKEYHYSGILLGTITPTEIPA